MQQHKQLPNMCRFTYLAVIRTLYISAHHGPAWVLPSLCDSDRAWTDRLTCQPPPEKKIVLGPAYAISLFPEVSGVFFNKVDFPKKSGRLLETVIKFKRLF